MAKVRVTASDWRDGFLFLGNQLALDFLNTCPVQDGQRSELLSDFDAVLRWFRAVGLLSSRQVDDFKHKWGASARARELTVRMRELREQLRNEILSWEGTGKVRRCAMDELNLIMAKHPMLTRLKRDPSGTTTEFWFEPGNPEDLFAPLRTVRRCYSRTLTRIVSESAEIACCISTTRVRRAHDAGAACSYVAVA